MEIEERMARTKQTQRSEAPRSSTSRGGRPLPRRALFGLVASLSTAAWALMMVTPPGQVVYAYLFVFTEFYGGVATLVLLSLTVMVGLVATDRIVLLIRHRVLLQSAHRAMGTVAVGTLGLHILTKIAEGHASVLDPVLPFVSGRGFFVGLGTLAGYTMVAVLWTGIVRMRFAGTGRPWMWRALHSTAYVSWPIALLHGLNAGRPPAGWVTLSYLICVLLVVAALLVRLSVSIGRKRRDSDRTTATIRPVGTAADEDGASRGKETAGGRRWPRRRESTEVQADRKLAGWTAGLRAGAAADVIDSWAPAGEYRPVGSPRGRFTVPRVPRRRYAEEQTVTPRGAGPGRATVYQSSAPEQPWDSPRRWSTPDRPAPYTSAPTTYASAPTTYGSGPIPVSGSELTTAIPDTTSDNYWETPQSWRATAEPTARSFGGGPRHSTDDDQAAYAPPGLQDDTPTLVDLASRRAMRAAEGTSSRSSRRRRASAEAVDGAYWTRLRGEAQ